MRVADIEGLRALIDQRHRELGRALVVGVSGYGGAGKSTVARELVRDQRGWVRMRGDDFLDPERSQRRSGDWDGVDRVRLVRDVIEPFKSCVTGTFRRFDWSRRVLGELELVPAGDVMIVDLIGLFHPEALHAIDVTIWCDVPMMVAAERGMQRDARLGRDHVSLWREVWIPNEVDFDHNFEPRKSAEVLYGS